MDGLHKTVNSWSVMKLAGLGWDLLPLSICFFICFPVQWRNQEGFWVGSRGSSWLRHQTAKLCIGKAPSRHKTHLPPWAIQESSYCLYGQWHDISSQLFRIFCPNFGNMWILVSAHIIYLHKKRFPQSASTRETQRTWWSQLLTTTYWLWFSFI